MQLLAGQTLGCYRIRGPIGVGGMGEVYLARDERLQRDVAIKVLAPDSQGDAELLLRQEREAQALALLSHPNIAAIYDFGQEGTLTYLALEYVPGQTLAARLEKRPLTEREAVQVCLQIAEGLETAHEVGLIHRDLKPSNVRITDEGVVKVLDFGLARPVFLDPSDDEETGSRELTRAGVILGTPAYMSPEQARSLPLDRRTDVWSFGCLIYECLTGDRAFHGATAFDVLMSVVDDEPDWERLPAGLSPALRSLVERCLRKDARRRLRDIGEARVLLEDLTQGNGAVASEGVRPVTRSLVAVGAVAIACWIAYSLPRAPGSEAEGRVRKFEIAPLTASWGTSLQSALSPKGDRVAYVSDGKIWVRELDRLEPRPVPGTEGGSHPAWSPDERWLAFVEGMQLFKVELGGDAPIPIAALPEQLFPAGGLSWSEDDRIAVATGVTGIRTVSASGGALRMLVEIDPALEKDLHQPSWLPGGQALLFGLHPNGSSARGIGAFDGQRRQTVLELPGQFLTRPVFSPSGHLVYMRGHTNLPEGRSLWAVPFSPTDLEVTGTPFQIATAGADPSVADDGTLLFEDLGTGGLHHLVWVDRTGKRVELVDELGSEFTLPLLSPDEASVALVRRYEVDKSDVWTLDLSRDTRSRLSEGNDMAAVASWSADGREIAYELLPSNGGSTQLYLVAADGRSEPRHLGAASAMTPDGSHVLIDEDEEGGHDLRLKSLATGEVVTLVQTPAREEILCLSPDGGLLAYHSNQSGRREIHLMSLRDRTLSWQVSSGGGELPRFASLDRLYYVSPDNELLEVVLSANGSPSEPEVVFVGADTGISLWEGYDASSRTGRFLVLQDREEGKRPSRLVVVENWFAEFDE